MDNRDDVRRWTVSMAVPGRWGTRDHPYTRRRAVADSVRGRRDVPGGPQDGHPLGQGRQADLHPHAGWAPALPRGRGPGAARGDPRAARRRRLTRTAEPVASAPMADAQLLTNAVRHYAWGSRTVLPQLLGLPVPAVEPWAEIWIGAHPTDPSLLPDGRSLAEVEPHLPYLVKLLAADVPLSIQAHPSRAQARAGYAREEAAGLPVSAAERTYKDANHKPELLVALQPTEALCGFRAPGEILALARQLGSPGFSRLVE